MKVRFDDCIYCGKRAGAGEHTLLAGLGGRRTNKSILCRGCDAGFSTLDAKLIEQLAQFRGLIGVRPDHRSSPVPTHVETDEGVLVLDAMGQPSWQTPRLRSETPLPDGSTLAIVECTGEEQLQHWRASMREQGIDARCVDRNAGARFFEHPIHFSWIFGGDEAFREIARIALNFVADQFPHIARLPALSAIKKWIRGELEREANELPCVWFNDGTVSLPLCAFEFGHRVALRLDARSGELYALVSFFDAFEYVVAFGAIGVDVDALLLVDVDPLVETPPNDRIIVNPTVDPFERLVRPYSIDTTDEQRGYLQTRLVALRGRIEDRQAALLFETLLPRMNAVRDLPALERHEQILDVLADCRGYILKLARHLDADLRRSARTAVELRVATAFTSLIQYDASADDGLTEMARASLFLASAALASEIDRELRDAPLSLERMILLLNGGPGAAIVFRALMQPILVSLGITNKQIGW